MKPEDVEIEAWPTRRGGGQHAGPERAGVIAVHKPTGIAVIVGVDDRSSQMKNRLRALARLEILVAATDVETDEWRAT